MRKFVEKIGSMPLALAAIMTVMVSEARAELEGGGGGSGGSGRSGTIGDAADGLMNDIGNVGKVAVAGGFLMGLFMVVTGLIKLKAAAESQGGQVKYSEGLWRVCVGAGLVSIPAFTGMLTGTFGFGDATGDISNRGGATF
ncbi:hypothetical protein [Roseibium sp. RKSG952]|uniref:hypothetical protein n=1 Tax=Roseibium sp. RKSG952 TaxID=2529384 RepID=UPI0012BC848A|nr:hypothetical protein [Roseibium sp. RKSG952]MTH95994.1 hypothetical protein [Roseibium sp. RKSG952]